jgi:hypothetical protein
MTGSKRPDEREQSLRFYLERLKKHAGLCSNATNEILQYHVQFAGLMAKRIDDASKPQYDLKYDYFETTRLASNIRASADKLSTYVREMNDDLGSFVSVLEEVQATVKEGPSLVESVKNILRWIWGWLKYLFQAIARILAKLSDLLHPAEPKREILPSTLEEGAAKFCTADSGAFTEHIILPCKDRSDRLFDAEPQEGKVSESLDSVILFLKRIVPREAQNAKKNLKRFDEALNIIGLERHMREGRRVTLSGPDPAAVAREWRE